MLVNLVEDDFRARGIIIIGESIRRGLINEEEAITAENLEGLVEVLALICRRAELPFWKRLRLKRRNRRC